MIDTIVFDFDGTLIDTNRAVLESWQAAARELIGHEFSYDRLKTTLGEPLEHTASYLFPDHDTEESVAAYRRFHYEHFQDMIEVFPGVPEMLDRLKKEGYHLVLVTNRRRRTTEIGLKQYGLETYFDAIVTVGEAPKDKPEPEHIWHTLDLIGRGPEAVNGGSLPAILVGDSQNDMQGGHNAGLKTVRVGWAMATDEAHGNEAAAPDFTIDKPSNLFDVLDIINRRCFALQ
jgi:pyrophosphatase PpaX